MIDEDMSKFLVKRIERSKHYIEMCLKEWGTTSSDKVPPRIYYSLASDTRTIAVYTTLLGDKEEAIKWFKLSSDYFNKQVESQRIQAGDCSYESEAAICKDAFNMAIISGDCELINKSIELSINICKEYQKSFQIFLNIITI